jgi:spore maturation protein CgeB
VYSGSLDSFYQKNPEIDRFLYEEHLRAFLDNSTEFVGSYLKNFRKLGFDAKGIIANDKVLQKKWEKEHRINNHKTEEILFEQVKSFQPEILWIENLSLVDEEWLNNVRKNVKSIRLIIGYHCAPINSKIKESIKGIDLIITCTPGLKLLFESYGKESFLVYHGFDSDILSRLNNLQGQYSNGFVFSGSLTTGGNFHDDRIRLIEQILKEKLEIDLYVNIESKFRIRTKQAIFLINSLFRNIGLGQVAGNFRILEHGKARIENYSDALLSKRKPPLFGMDMYNLFYRSKIVLNYHIGVAGDYAGNMRMFEVTGVGSCLLTDNKKNISDLFEPDNEIVVYKNADECIAKAKWLLENDEERKKISVKGQQKTLESHTVLSRCETVLEIINGQLKKTGK